MCSKGHWTLKEENSVLYHVLSVCVKMSVFNQIAWNVFAIGY